MKPSLKVLFALTLAALPLTSVAQMTCEEALTPGPTQFHGSLLTTTVNEFQRAINPDYFLEIDRMVNSEDIITDAKKTEFQRFLKHIDSVDRVQKRDASAFLGRPLSDIEATGLRLARALGRTERGADEKLFAFSGNYTRRQIERKDRILELAGFSFDERFALLENKFADDVITKFAADQLFIDQAKQTAEEASAMNEAVMKNAAAESYKTSDSKRKQSIAKKESTEIYEDVTRNPIVRLMNALKYDPTGEVGFCFGRAFVSHIEALRRGVDKDAVRKVLVVGNIKAIFGMSSWKYHVATAVKANDGGWWIIDPFFGKTVKLEERYAGMKKHDIGGNMRLYMTEASRFGPDSQLRYTKKDMFLKGYNNYFVDVLQYFRLKSKGTEPKKKLWIKAVDKALSIFHLGF